MKPKDRLSNYATYRGHTITRPLRVVQKQPRKPKSMFVLIAVLLLGGVLLFTVLRSDPSPADKAKLAVLQAMPEAEPINNCATNRLDQQILIDISRRHLWACKGTEQVYDSAVITGREHLVENKTPRGNFQIYAKATDQYLTGSDSTGKWDVKVNYWMPFLDNQYGTYGFHDATWRPKTDFGKVGADSNDASHGCIQMPLNALEWLYNWASEGTTVTVQD